MTDPDITKPRERAVFFFWRNLCTPRDPQHLFWCHAERDSAQTFLSRYECTKCMHIIGRKDENKRSSPCLVLAKYRIVICPEKLLLNSVSLCFVRQINNSLVLLPFHIHSHSISLWKLSCFSYIRR